jgi:SAM-dependent methyltransferase
MQTTSLLEVRSAIAIRAAAPQLLIDQSYEVPYVPTPLETVKRMLEIANAGPEDVVYDLGCGDGRILIAATELFNVRKAVGYEIRKDLCKNVLQEVNRLNLGKKIIVINGDLFEADISEATLITLYLTYGANKRLQPKLEREARHGCKIVSHNFEMPGWRPTRKESYEGDDIYLYTMPDSALMRRNKHKMSK